MDALQPVGDNLPHLRTDAVVVLLNHLLHAVVAVGIGEVRDDGDRLVSLFHALHLPGIHHYLTMKNLLLDALVEIVRHRPDEHALREHGNLARQDKALLLRVDGGGLVLTVDGDTLPLLQDFAETLRTWQDTWVIIPRSIKASGPAVARFRKALQCIVPTVQNNGKFQNRRNIPEDITKFAYLWQGK